MILGKAFAYIIVFVLGFTAISLWHFYFLTHPNEIASGLTPENFNMPAEDVRLTAPDGTELAGWFIESGVSKPALILLHGYPTDKGDLLPIARTLQENFSILLLDARYFGESGGNATTLGIKERRDVRAAVDFLEGRGYKRIGLLGYSMGGATALMAAAEDSRVNVVATYGAFSDVRSLGRDVFGNLFVLKYPMTELVLLWGRLAFGEHPMAVTPQSAAPQIQAPVLLSHARNDPLVPLDHLKRLKEALGGNPDLQTHIVETNRHFGIPDEFTSAAKTFFLDNLSASEPRTP